MCSSDLSAFRAFLAAFRVALLSSPASGRTPSIDNRAAPPARMPAPASPAQVAELDRFLDQHPDISRQLAEKPQLLRQTQFLNSHPALRDYVKQHPELVRPATPPKANAANKAAAPRANQSAAAGAKPLGTPAQRSNADDKSGTSEKTGATP